MPKPDCLPAHFFHDFLYFTSPLQFTPMKNRYADEFPCTNQAFRKPTWKEIEEMDIGDCLCLVSQSGIIFNVTESILLGMSAFQISFLCLRRADHLLN